MMGENQSSNSDICECVEIPQATLYRCVGPDGEVAASLLSTQAALEERELFDHSACFIPISDQLEQSSGFHAKDLWGRGAERPGHFCTLIGVTCCDFVPCFQQIESRAVHLIGQLDETVVFLKRRPGPVCIPRLDVNLHESIVRDMAGRVTLIATPGYLKCLGVDHPSEMV